MSTFPNEAATHEQAMVSSPKVAVVFNNALSSGELDMKVLNLRLAKMKQDDRLLPNGYMKPKETPTKLYGRFFRRPKGQPPKGFQWHEKLGLWKLVPECMQLLRDAGLEEFFFGKEIIENAQNFNENALTPRLNLPAESLTIGARQSIQHSQGSKTTRACAFARPCNGESSESQTPKALLVEDTSTLNDGHSSAKRMKVSFDNESATSRQLEAVMTCLVQIVNLDHESARQYLGQNGDDDHINKLNALAKSAYHILWDHKDGCRKYDFLTKIIQRAYALNNDGNALRVTIWSLKMIPEDWSAFEKTWSGKLVQVAYNSIEK
ncbi:hypothetical protein MPSEU_000303100 [Mayamaea pseudoterrestris]|nr:hypothetical protein MPSEU_000303100 [Mayamaea pseudoterrestris]